MPFAPQQDWNLFDQRAHAPDVAWLRGLDASDRFDIYCDLFDVILEGRDPKIDWQRVEAEQWRAKLTMRLRLTEALKKLDNLRGTRT